MDELTRFIEVWDREARKTVSLLRALPRDKYDFRPDAEGRSLGEMAWHLAETDAYMTHGVEKGRFDVADKPPGIERPKKIEELATGFEKVHRDAVGRVRKLKPADLDRSVPFFTAGPLPVRDILWDMCLLHGIHHRGQLSMLCRLAGGTPPAVFGPTREQMPLPKAKDTAKTR